MLENEDGSLKSLLPRRPGKFVDEIIEREVAVKTKNGMVIVYNTLRLKKGGIGDRILGSGLGQALIDSNDPTRVIARSEKPFLVPDREYEIEGNVNNVVFNTGLALYNNRRPSLLLP